MFKNDGRAAYPESGDWLICSFARDAAVQMPVNSLAASARTDRVAGRCLANAPYKLLVRKQRFFGTTDSNGRLEVDASRRLDVQHGDQLNLYCMFPTGDLWHDTGTAF